MSDKDQVIRDYQTEERIKRMDVREIVEEIHRLEDARDRYEKAIWPNDRN